MAGAHPRSRGENSPRDRCPIPIQGSSPLARGKRFAQASARMLAGLIPARAGKTATAS